MLTLKAEVILSGSGCPICGGKKTKPARTDRFCFLKYGFEATRAVDTFMESLEAAKAGHEAAVASGNNRSVVWSVLANVYINKDAKLNVPTNKAIEPYYSSGKNVPGGYLNISIFGANTMDIGRFITGMAELKTRQVKGQTVHYLRVQKVDGFRSNATLMINQESVLSGMSDELPKAAIRDIVVPQTESSEGRMVMYGIGFHLVKGPGIAA